MLKTNLSDIFSDLNSESSVILPKSIKIKNINSVDTVVNTTSSFMPQNGAYSEATSSFMPQKGGYSDATSSFMPQKGGYLNGTKNKDIQQLISMLSATSDDNYTANSTTNSTDNTEELKNKLFNIIQSGGVFEKEAEEFFNRFMIFFDNYIELYNDSEKINSIQEIRKYFRSLDNSIKKKVLADINSLDLGKDSQTVKERLFKIIGYQQKTANSQRRFDTPTPLRTASSFDTQVLANKPMPKHDILIGSISYNPYKDTDSLLRDLKKEFINEIKIVIEEKKKIYSITTGVDPVIAPVAHVAPSVASGASGPSGVASGPSGVASGVASSVVLGGSGVARF